MRVSKLLFVLAIAIATAGAAWVYAQGTRPSGVLSPQDFLEIDQLIQSYTRGIDLGPEDPSWVFTSDGVFVSPDGREVRGAKELKEFYQNVRKNHVSTRPKERHVLSNLVVKASPEGATASVYITTVEAQAPSNPIAIRWYGMYEDTLVKTAAGWRIKRRVDTHAN